MFVNILIGLIIFGYAGWMMARHIKKSKQGKCAACEMNKSCSSSCSIPDAPTVSK
ncbi:FeoB-associated Cys-rich membrane protein [Paenibacillus sp. BSR1-1]|uniref:FeoB-associated Cys-rich membrane protein n=1 Tax=Paenibacillus sp. BSR1-1 TaxID=3020845 RepID=UPI0025B21090|nr:FeoB-associated Cys-rich membrane protein [Paenibacillus sp. BSR1-1]MDN3018969.1 FeoB-associated Cys-rich membrane protein [Paenibacillus sp. BSR1-1]